MKLSSLICGAVTMLSGMALYAENACNSELSKQANRGREIVLTIDEAQQIVRALEVLEEEMTRAARDDGGGAAVPNCCPENADLAIIRTCICAIKNQLCAISQQTGSCTDPVITAVTDATCITQAEISAICASLQSWVKTIVSELRGNQTTCPS